MRPHPVARRPLAFYLAEVERWSAEPLAVRRMAIWILTSLALLSLALWLWSIPAIDPRGMSDLGLVSQLPPASFVACALLAAGFALSLRLRPTCEPLMFLYVGAWIFMAFGIGTMLYDFPRLTTTYVHAGIAEAIGRTGELFPNLDARFDWPVFFVLVAFASDIAGLEHPIQLAAWVPVISNALYLVPLAIIFRSFTSDGRLVWLAVWIFFITTWVGQDYLSPQGFNLLLYLTVLAILVRWFAPPSTQSVRWLDGLRARFFGPARDDPESREPALLAGAPGSKRQRAGLVLIVIVLFAISVSSHQLTPIVLLGSVTGLVIFRRCTLRAFPILMTAILAGWLTFMAITYLSGHLAGLIAEIGRAESVANAAVVSRVQGSQEHQFVVLLRIALSGAVWLLAAIGALRRLRARYWDLTAAVLAVAPFGMVLLLVYGGEVLLRVYLLSLPFMAYFAAAAFYPAVDRARVITSGLIVLATALLMTGFLVARYGNERADFITPAEVMAVDLVYDLADPDDLVVAATSNSPLLLRDFEIQKRMVAFDVVDPAILHDLSREAVNEFAEAVRWYADGDTFLIITRSQIAALEMFEGVKPGAVDALIERLRQRDDFHTLIANPDAIIFAVDRPSSAN